MIRQLAQRGGADARRAESQPKEQACDRSHFAGDQLLGYTMIAEKAEARIMPIKTVSTAVATSPTCGKARENGATPRIENQITRLRPIRSPTGPPTIVPRATEKRKTKRKSCDVRIETLKRSIR